MAVFIGIMMFVMLSAVFIFILWLANQRYEGKFYTPREWSSLGNKLQDNDLVWVFQKDGLVSCTTYRTARDRNLKCYVVRPGCGSPDRAERGKQ